MKNGMKRSLSGFLVLLMVFSAALAA